MTSESLKVDFTGEFKINEITNPDEYLIGQGNFSLVYRSSQFPDLVIKRFRSTVSSEDKTTELSNCSRLKGHTHDNLVKVLDVYPEKDEVHLAFCSGGTLLSAFQRDPKRLSYPITSIKVYKQLLNGLVELHKLGFIHRDITMRNLLVNEGFVKIGDYGLCVYGANTATNRRVQSSDTNAPEQLVHKKYDVYCLGRVFLQLWSGNLFTKEKTVDILTSMRAFDSRLFDLISHMVSDAEDDRPTAEVALDQIMQINFDVSYTTSAVSSAYAAFSVDNRI